MSIVGKVYEVGSRRTTTKLFSVWETELLSSHPSKHRLKFIEDGTKMICLGCYLVGDIKKPVTKLLIDGVIWYTYLDPIADPNYFEEL